jgi:hypothetical protein
MAPADPFAALPPLDPAAEPAALARPSDGIVSVLRVARVLAQARRPVDLDGLERVVGPLCAGALDLPPADGRALRPLLVALLAELDALAAAFVPP